MKADWGWLICAGFKWYGKPGVKLLTIRRYKDWRDNLPSDEALVRDVYKMLAEADMYVTFFGKGFDQPWLQSKFMKYRLPALPNTAHVDLFYTAKGNMRLSRKSLDNVTKFLGLGEKKFYVEGDMWQKARVGNPAAIKQVEEHCVQDVLITEELYTELRPYVRQHPRVGDDIALCRHCGSDKMQRRGYAMTTLLGKRQRWQCMSCAAWDTRSLAHSDLTDTMVAGVGSE